MKTHRTPRYILARLRELIFQKINPDVPWLGPQAVRKLSQLLKPQMRGLEVGAGRSTAWVAKRVSFLESWEESLAWTAKIKLLLAEKRLENVTLKRVLPTPEAYQNLLETIEAETLDFALVDSEHCRDILCLGLLSKIKKAGFLMLDNANWFLPSNSHSPHSRKDDAGAANDLWKRFLEETADWQCIWTSSGVTDTAFFRKP